LFEQDAMHTIQTYLSHPTDEEPSLENIQYYRIEVLSLLLDSSLSVSSRLLEQTIQSEADSANPRIIPWAAAWTLCGQRNPKWRAMSALLRVSEPISSDALTFAKSVMEMPEVLEPLVNQSLQHQLSIDFQSHQSASYWSMLFTDSLPTWLNNWREDNAAGLFWLSVRLRRAAKDDALMQAGQTHSAWLFLSQLKSEQVILESEGRKWCQALPTDGDSILDFNAVVDEVMPVNVAHGLQMFGWTDLELPLKKILEGPELYQWTPGPSTAQDIAVRISKGLELDTLLLRIVLAYSGHISKDLSETVLRSVAQGCDLFYQQVFFGADCSSDADQWNEIAAQVVLELLLNDVEMPKRIYHAVSQPKVAQHRSCLAFRKQLHEKIKEDSIEQPQDLLLRVLFCIGRSMPAPPIDVDSIPALTWLLDGFDLANASELVADLNSIRALLQLQPRQLLLPGSRLFEIVSNAQVLSEFKAIALDRQWREQPVWRLMFVGEEQPTQLQKSSNEEMQFFNQLQADACLIYLDAGYILPDHQLSAMTQLNDSSSSIQASALSDLHRLASIAVHSDSQSFHEAIVKLAFEAAETRQELDSLLSRYVLPIPWYKKVLSVLDTVSKTVERSLSTKLKLDCETVSEAVDSFFVTLGREALAEIYHKSKRSS
ncbi:MAG: hypothetical protein VXZ96_06745, partial [Myxococcota bacterium]|nr:hypothetical protein [Myxococcota bacterium]